MQISSNLPLRSLIRPESNQVQPRQLAKADGTVQGNASNPAAAVKPVNRTQRAERARENESTESTTARAREAANRSEDTRLDVFA